MNKTELIKKVAAENGLSQKAAAAAVDLPSRIPWPPMSLSR